LGEDRAPFSSQFQVRPQAAEVSKESLRIF
jgi:hypothetical protein